MLILPQYGIVRGSGRFRGISCWIVSALFKYEPDEDDERQTYSTPDGPANHAT